MLMKFGPQSEDGKLFWLNPEAVTGVMVHKQNALNGGHLQVHTGAVSFDFYYKTFQDAETAALNIVKFSNREDGTSRAL
jgi:hypothetical protein